MLAKIFRCEAIKWVYIYAYNLNIFSRENNLHDIATWLQKLNWKCLKIKMNKFYTLHGVFFYTYLIKNACSILKYKKQKMIHHFVLLKLKHKFKEANVYFFG